MQQFKIPIADEWYTLEQSKKYQSKEDYIPIKPEWVKVEFDHGVPFLFANSNNIWLTRPVTRKVYNTWLAQALEEYETSTSREATA